MIGGKYDIFRAISKVGKYEDDVNSDVWLYETDKYEPTLDVVINRRLCHI